MKFTRICDQKRLIFDKLVHIWQSHGNEARRWNPWANLYHDQIGVRVHICCHRGLRRKIQFTKMKKINVVKRRKKIGKKRFYFTFSPFANSFSASPAVRAKVLSTRITKSFIFNFYIFLSSIWRLVEALTVTGFRRLRVKWRLRL